MIITYQDCYGNNGSESTSEKTSTAHNLFARDFEEKETMLENLLSCRHFYFSDFEL